MRLTNVQLIKLVFVFNSKYPIAPRALRPVVVYLNTLGTSFSRRRYCGDSFRTALFSCTRETAFDQLSGKGQ